MKTKDNKFVVTTIYSGEKDGLISILPEYVKHIT